MTYTPIKSTLNIPSKISLDIYIWHRLILVILFILGYELNKYDAIIIYTTTFFISAVYRFLINKTKLYLNKY